MLVEDIQKSAFLGFGTGLGGGFGLLLGFDGVSLLGKGLMTFAGLDGLDDAGAFQGCFVQGPALGGLAQALHDFLAVPAVPDA
ncbi:MAG: hypothetical protein LDL27_08675, partial [Desulfovibrio sp.]|nr:hypothetical protein [Desulfovibrio sp.]